MPWRAVWFRPWVQGRGNMAATGRGVPGGEVVTSTARRGTLELQEG